ncbi:Pimeloyl-ACP methyl ester carboxylesterase [Raineyella antarctica]|uniref:Pimeloyl-ACP methyl ester carboxylesterase n=1 Tax=Raineyella antarctica TaxID=1577474 RepID=A0A1G6GVJ0_9ACTN|nr:alpha/beta hydrolase [Raineyella antarctica]SDB85974.1 Pimeloyl-ACP methyl ester carboxylesterase [Raineyella antarctica]
MNRTALEPISKTFVDLDDGTSLALHTCTPDDDRGVVVLVHGIFGSKEDFDAVLPRLAAEGFTVCALDQRGCYESSSEGPFSLETFAEDVIALVEEIGSDIPVHLVGQGFGGLVVEEAALLEPDFWDSVTLVSSGPGGLGRTEPLAFVEEQLAGDRPLAEINQEFLDMLHMSQDQPAELVAERLAHTDRRAVAAMIDAAEHTPDRTQALHETGIDFHIVFGEYADSWPIAGQIAMARGLDAEPVVLKGCKDHPVEDSPQAAARALVHNFLQLD